MKALLTFLALLALVFTAPAQNATPIYNLQRGTNTLASTNWIPVVTRPNQTNGTQRYSLSDLSSFLGTSGGGLSSGVAYVNVGDNLYAAKLAAIAAGKSTIVVGPGTYTNGVTNLFWNGTWFFQGPTLRYIGNVLDHGSGIFDDRFSGAVTCNVQGWLSMEYCPGTNVHWDEVCNATGHTNAHGAVTVTNARTFINWDANVTTGVSGPAPIPYALYIANCQTNSTFSGFDLTYDLFPSGSITVTNCPADPGTPYVIQTGYNFALWYLGTMHLHFGSVLGTYQYGLISYGVDTTDKTDLYMTGDYMEGIHYSVGFSSNYRVWLDVLEIKSGRSGSPPLTYFNSGRYYVRSQKISAPVTVIGTLHTGASASTDTNLFVWLEVEKMSAPRGWIENKHGEITGRVGHFEQSTNLANFVGILNTNLSASINLSGEQMNASSNSLVVAGGGFTRLSGYRITSTNGDPVMASGGALELHNIHIQSGGTNSIRALAPQNVNVGQGLSANLPPHRFVYLNRTTTNWTDNVARPLFSATNYGTIYDAGEWVKIFDEEFSANVTATTSGQIGQHPWNLASTGTLPALSPLQLDSGAYAYISIVTTQSTSGRILNCPQAAGGATGYALTNAEYYLESRIRVSATNVASDVATMRVGFGNNGASANGELLTGAYFMINTNANTNTLVLVTARNSSYTFNITPYFIAPATWYTVGLHLDATGTNAVLMAGLTRRTMTAIATNNLNMPGLFALCTGIIQNDRMASTSGTNFRTNFVDNFKIWVRDPNL